MAITFNADLQKFNAFVSGIDANADPNGDTIVQLDGNKDVAAATHTTGAFGRWFCISSEAEKSRHANNVTRGAFLAAIANEFNGMANIPASVKRALQLDDYGLTRRQDGLTGFTSGKPLTARRIARVLAAVTDEVETRRERLIAAEPGQQFGRRDTVIRGVLATNPRLVQQDGVLNYLGDTVAKSTKIMFEVMLERCNSGDKLTLMRNYRSVARKVAERVNSLALQALEAFDRLMDTDAFRAVLEAPARDGTPADARRIAMRRHVFVEKMLDSAFTSVFGSRAFALDDDDALLQSIMDWTVDTATGKPTDGRATYVMRSQENIVDILLGFEDKVAADHGVHIPADVLDLVWGAAVDAGFNNATPDECVHRANGFAEMFTATWNASGQNANKALGLFSTVLSVKIAKPFFVTAGKEILDSLGAFDLQLPRVVNRKTLEAFFRRLAEKIHAKATEIGARSDEFGAQDTQSLFHAFTILLFTARPDVRDWLKHQDAAAIIAAEQEIGAREEPNPQEVGVDEYFTYVAVSTMASALMAAKIYAD